MTIKEGMVHGTDLLPISGCGLIHHETCTVFCIGHERAEQDRLRPRDQQKVLQRALDSPPGAHKRALGASYNRNIEAETPLLERAISMTVPEKPWFSIVGAGLAGALMACYLGKAGYRVDVYEKRSDPRSQDQTGGKSINLAISVRGIHALREVGLADEI